MNRIFIEFRNENSCSVHFISIKLRCYRPLPMKPVREITFIGYYDESETFMYYPNMIEPHFVKKLET